jgi:GntR family transcriptional regulator
MKNLDLPFRIELKTGLPVHEQVVFAVHKAVLSGQLREGDPFPSVRALGQALRINPNTAHRIVQTLVARGVLAVRPGIGTVVADAAVATRTEKQAVLEGEVERLVVEARRLGLEREEITAAVERHWKRTDRR